MPLSKKTLKMLEIAKELGKEPQYQAIHKRIRAAKAARVSTKPGKVSPSDKPGGTIQ